MEQPQKGAAYAYVAPARGFAHNGVAAAALLPAACLALGFAHHLVAGVGVIGLIATTIFDLSGAKEATFVGIWLTVLLSFVGNAIALLVDADRRYCFRLLVFFFFPTARLRRR